jgi:hypothetical protein
MTIDGVKDARRQAILFLAAVEAVQKELTAEDWKYEKLWVSGTKATGALRRQSMELTRSLARLRA